MTAKTFFCLLVYDIHACEVSRETNCGVKTDSLEVFSSSALLFF